MLLLPLAASIMDLERSRVCLDWRNFGNLEVLVGVEAEDEWRDLEDIRIGREREGGANDVVESRRRRRCCGRWREAEAWQSC